MQTDYLKYRGKCKEFCEELMKQDSELRLVRGYYYCPIWNTEEPHWWCIKPDGTIIDPTKNQFPSKGVGEYVEFDGKVYCAQCGKEWTEETAMFYGNYSFCPDGSCVARFVGL